MATKILPVPDNQKKFFNLVDEVWVDVDKADISQRKRINAKILKLFRKNLSSKFKNPEDEIYSALEKLLVDEGLTNIAKTLIVRRKELDDLKRQKEMLGVRDELDFSYNSLVIIKNKYLQKNEKGDVIENTREWLERVSEALAQAEEKDNDKKIWKTKFFDVMKNLEFLPAGRTLANAGTINGQLANCFVLPFEDNIEEIFEVVRESSILKKNGGGVGFSFSKIRPKGDHIATTTGGACGPVALMKILDSASEILLQAGGRRSGNMIILSVSHPDVLEFITCKEQENVLNQINYSLGVSDKFMKAVEKNKEWELVNPRTGKTEQKISAANIFNFASSSAWRNGDPGMIFLDRINKDNPTPHVGFIEAVNLCGEQPLLPYEACNLGSINLTKFLKNKRQKNADFDFVIEGFDWKHLEEVVRIATRMLDNVISVCRYPVSKVDRVVKANRKIGLGVMGWADALIKMGIPYNSEKAYKLAERLMKFISDISHDESQILGKLKGSFPHFPGSVWQKKGFKHMRNSTCTTIAPTGSISMTAGVSSGIEPVFALLYYKQVMGGIKLPEVNKDLLSGLYKSYKVSRPYNNYNEYQEYVISEIAKCGSIQKIIDVSDKIRKVFVTAMDISYDDHIRMQAAFQKFTDNAVSKTINLPNSATVDDVKKAFFSAWKMGCKGITVYRDKSRNVQVLNIGKTTIDQMTDNFIQAKKNPAFDPTKCPDCGGILVKEEGCMNCPSCGFSACSV